MNADNIKDTNRYIVNQLHYGNICPGNRSEMWRNIFLESGAHVKGSIFGNNLTVLNTGVVIENSVYVRGEIKIILSKGKKDDQITFESTVTTPDSLLVEGDQSVVHFNSDIYVNKLNLSNAIVYGNVYSNSAIIKNCVILGGIYCKKKLSLENSIIYTFDTNELEMKKNTSLLSPFGISKSAFTLDYPVRALTFFSLNEEVEKESVLIELDQEDIFQLKINTHENGENDSSEKYILSVVERLLNITDIIEAFRYNKKVINFLSLGSHIDPNWSEEFSAFKKQEIESRLWSIINKNIKQNEKRKREKLSDIINKIKLS